MEQAAIRLKRGEGRSFKAGGPWIYDNEIGEITPNCEDGGIVRIEDYNGYVLGWGFLNRKSTIAVRVLSRKADAVIDEAFLEARVRAAWQYRKDTVETDSCRVIFGEADFLPGLVVDKFSDVLVVESLALGIDRLKDTILKALVKVLAEDGITIRGIYERSDAKVRLKEGMERVKGFLSTPFDTKVEILENGVRYLVDVEEGQKTGYFLDQKYNRRAIQPLCRGKRVLDCFTHTGAFALNAAVAGAHEVIGVDASETGVRQAEENARLNGVEDRVKFLCRDVFDLLPEMDRNGERFDVVILDPPAFTKSRDSVKKAVRGYREINLRGIRLVENGGYLATCSCSHFMTPELFTNTIAQAARDARRRLRQVEYRTQSADHPILWGADESYYLKFYIFQVCDDM
ncbi:MAG: class I SAM-dependent rRNA methyltransferase [Pseudoflavonifractor capillosus]|uniref:class I SAM-dependent rRNA methyltransferase n=1 Tax=Pseudoflavonifractor capillosus TaxID=106588 RepID=UPI0023F6447E|nr:class I SAM-dependent rRNA methyltransferase [Pseudoflavonifractor capillosus]MCI5929065.1 class I SAM-dependent rRNA methyltransferase [Pseudoflavonifractor capillosus]MDY4662548.1 class I SAM-dependent rRNA methyltransferase [Pseudoflavonifractor capillosus]